MNTTITTKMNYETASRLRPGDLVTFRLRCWDSEEPCDKFIVGCNYPVVSINCDTGDTGNVVITVRLPSGCNVSYGQGWFDDCVIPQGTYLYCGGCCPPRTMD